MTKGGRQLARIMRFRKTSNFYTAPHFMLLVLFSILSALPFQLAKTIYQRCLDSTLGNSSTHAVLRQNSLLANSCEACEQQNSESFSNNRSLIELHVIAQITSPNPPAEILSICSGLIEHDINVTVFYMAFSRPLMSDNFGTFLRRRILSGISCYQQEQASKRLSIYAINIASSTSETCVRAGKRAHRHRNPFQHCFVALGVNQYRTMKSFLIIKNSNLPPNLILTEFYGFGSLILAEKYGIPALLITDDWALSETPGLQENKHCGWWSWRRYIFPNGISQSLATSRSYIELNRLRQSAGLPLKRAIQDFWDAATGIVVLTNQPSTTLTILDEHQPPILYFGNPLLPPCIPCEIHQDVEKGKHLNTLDVIVLPPSDLTTTQVREILRALTLAKRSLGSHDSSCRSGSPNCWDHPVDMHVKWMDNGELPSGLDVMGSPLPLFVEKRNATLFLNDVLESLERDASHKSLIVITMCDDNVRPALLLQIPALCLPSSNNDHRGAGSISKDSLEILQDMRARNIAVKFLQLVWKVHSTTVIPLASNIVDSKGVGSLQHVLAAIRVAAQVSHSAIAGQTLSSVSSDSHMIQRSFASTLTATPIDWKDLRPDCILSDCLVTLSVSLACIVIALSCIYLGSARVSFCPGHWRISKSLRNHFTGLAWQTIFARVPEIDHAWGQILGLWERTILRTHSRPPCETQQQRNKSQSKCPSSKSGAKLQSKKRAGKSRSEVVT